MKFMQILAMKSLKSTEMMVSAYRVQQHMNSVLGQQAQRKNSQGPTRRATYFNREMEKMKSRKSLKFSKSIDSKTSKMISNKNSKSARTRLQPGNIRQYKQIDSNSKSVEQNRTDEQFQKELKKYVQQIIEEEEDNKKPHISVRMDKMQRLKRLSLQRKVDYVNKHSSRANVLWDLDPEIVNLAEWADL